MTSEQLLDAIGQIDDDLIAEAAVTPRRIPLRALIGLAAALMLCVGLLYVPTRLSDDAKMGQAAAPEAADGAAEDIYLYDQEYQYTADSANRDVTGKTEMSIPQASVTAGKDQANGTAAGVFEPRFITPRGTYLPIAIPDPDAISLPLPADAVSLGPLQAHPCDDTALSSTPTEALVGCPVWESVDGSRLYIQLEAGWIVAELVS